MVTRGIESLLVENVDENLIAKVGCTASEQSHDESDLTIQSRAEILPFDSGMAYLSIYLGQDMWVGYVGSIRTNY